MTHHVGGVWLYRLPDLMYAILSGVGGGWGETRAKGEAGLEWKRRGIWFDNGEKRVYIIIVIDLFSSGLKEENCLCGCVCVCVCVCVALCGLAFVAVYSISRAIRLSHCRQLFSSHASEWKPIDRFDESIGQGVAAFILQMISPSGQWARGVHIATGGWSCGGWWHHHWSFGWLLKW